MPTRLTHICTRVHGYSLNDNKHVAECTRRHFSSIPGYLVRLFSCVIPGDLSGILDPFNAPYIYLIWIIYRSVNYNRLHDWNALECDMRYLSIRVIRIILLTLSSQFFSLFDHLIVKFDFWRIVLVSVYAHG